MNKLNFTMYYNNNNNNAISNAVLHHRNKLHFNIYKIEHTYFK